MDVCNLLYSVPLLLGPLSYGGQITVENSSMVLPLSSVHIHFQIFLNKIPPPPLLNIKNDKVFM